MDNSFSRRAFLKNSMASISAISLLSNCKTRDKAVQKSKPNVVYIMADDLCYRDIGCYGQEMIKTPNIDKIAEEGMRFTNCYAGSTVCAPSRCCLMTGMHTGHARVRNNSSKEFGRVPLLPEDVTIAEILKGAGYTTGMFGKWALGEAETTGIPNKKGFDTWFGYLNQHHAHNYYPSILWNNKKLFFPEGEYSHDIIAREALKFLKTNKDKPFFMYVPFTIPHQRHEIPSDEPYSNKPWSQLDKNYAAMITRMDNDIGKIMALLKEFGLEENTIVFFCSDNGSTKGERPTFFNSRGPFRGGKGDLYEGGMRVPMIVRWPGKIKADAVSEQIWAFWDFLPTACEIAGIETPKGIDGISMLPAILGKEQKEHEYLYWEHGTKQAVRLGDWKGIRLAHNKPIELYNLKTDLGEMNNIADKHTDIVKKVDEIMRTDRFDSKEFPI